MAGYIICACRDCFELTIGEENTLCDDCIAADCSPMGDAECQADHCDSCGCWKNAPEDCIWCEYSKG